MRGAIVALAGAMVLAGCATAIRGETEQVRFESDPAGAEMRAVVFNECAGGCDTSGGGINGVPYRANDDQGPVILGPICVTPCSAAVPRNQALMVTFTKPGYEPVTMKLEKKLSGEAGAMVGNVLAGGIVGVVVDSGTGASLDHQPNPMKAVLKPLVSAPVVPMRKR